MVEIPTNGMDTSTQNTKTDWIEAIVPFMQWTVKATAIGVFSAVMIWLTIGFYDRLALNQLEFNKDVVQYLKEK